MNRPLLPPRLQAGDTVRVIAPARSLAMEWLNNDELKRVAQKRFDQLGLKLTFGQHVYEIDAFDSSSIESRVADLHQAFVDPEVKMILTVVGGFNSNQLLKYLDYDLIANNPKILCGYSDITALANAIYARTGLVTYSGPHYFSFGDKHSFEYSLEYFKKCFFSDQPFEIKPSSQWRNDRWVGNQEDRNFVENDGLWVINPGQAQGTIIGGNQCTLNLLQGSEFMPDLSNTILFLEDDYEAHTATFDRDLQSLIHLPDFSDVRGLVIGRFQPESGVTRDLLNQIITTKKELKNIPVIANLDFGHTLPQITFPIGGHCAIDLTDQGSTIQITSH